MASVARPVHPDPLPATPAAVLAAPAPASAAVPFAAAPAAVSSSPGAAALAPAVAAATATATTGAGRAARLPAVDPRTPEGRAPGVLDRARRVALADRLADLVRLADGRVLGPLPAPRPALRAARGRLLELEHVLRSGIPVPRHGEHRVERLLDDVESGAYADGAPDGLHRDAAAACAATGSVTPFH